MSFRRFVILRARQGYANALRSEDAAPARSASVAPPTRPAESVGRAAPAKPHPRFAPAPTVTRR